MTMAQIVQVAVRTAREVENGRPGIGPNANLTPQRGVATSIARRRLPSNRDNPTRKQDLGLCTPTTRFATLHRYRTDWWLMGFAGRDGDVTGTRNKSPRLLDQVRGRMRVKHYSLRTEQAYVGWIRRFIMANGKRHPRDLGGPEVEAFLTRLATERNVAAGTQNQALAALLFLYRDVLRQDLPWMNTVVRAKRPRRVPVVLTRIEVQRLLAQLDGREWLMAGLLYGSGMRLMECLRLRVKDLDFQRREIIVRPPSGP